MVTLMEGLREAEENILECLGSGHRLLYNLAATKKLASIKKQHEEIVEGLVLILSFPRSKCNFFLLVVFFFLWEISAWSNDILEVILFISNKIFVWKGKDIIKRNCFLVTPGEGRVTSVLCKGTPFGCFQLVTKILKQKATQGKKTVLIVSWQKFIKRFIFICLQVTLQYLSIVCLKNCVC